MGIKNNYYKLDKIFNEDYYYSMLTKPPVIRLGYLQKLLIQYKDQIQYYETYGEHLNFKTDQIHTREFYFDENQNYKITWNIKKAEDIIINEKIPITNQELKKISDSIFKKDLNLDHLKIAKYNYKPIIVIFYEPTQQYIPIDGNHRATARIQENKHSINAYILPPHYHIQAMCSTLDYALYMFAHNLNILGCYICGEINYDVFIDNMYRF